MTERRYEAIIHFTLPLTVLRTVKDTRKGSNLFIIKSHSIEDLITQLGSESSVEAVPLYPPISPSSPSGRFLSGQHFSRLVASNRILHIKVWSSSQLNRASQRYVTERRYAKQLLFGPHLLLSFLLLFFSLTEEKGIVRKIRARKAI